MKRSEFFRKIEDAITATTQRSSNGSFDGCIAVEQAKELGLFLPVEVQEHESKNPVVRVMETIGWNRRNARPNPVQEIALLEEAWEHYQEHEKRAST